MKINNLKINGFGQIENKEINLENGINLILGNNENGKSTILKCMQSMFYGLQKNKIGKEKSELEKYTPWFAKNFSGRMEYILDNQEKYTIYRNFSNSEIQILNGYGEDVTCNYGMDKSKGSTFFYEQTNIDEDIFKSTVLVEQGQIKLNKNRQSELIQKITNIVSSGSGNFSYKKATENLNKKLLEEIGTDRTNGRPINIVEKKLKELEKEKQEIKSEIEEQNNIKKERILLENKLHIEQDKLKLLRQMKNKTEKKQIENEKIKINKDMQNKYMEQLNDTKENIIKKNKEQKKISINKIKYFLISILFIISIIMCYFYIDKIGTVPIAISVCIFLIIFFTLILFDLIKNNKNKNKIISEIEIFEIQRKNLEENIKNTSETIKAIQKEITDDEEILLKKAISDFEGKISSMDIKKILDNSEKNIIKEIENQEKIINEIMIKLGSIENNQKYIEEKIEQLNTCEKEINMCIEYKKELKSLSNSIMLVKENLEIAYKKVKENITPNISNNLEKSIKKILGGTYNKVYMEEEGLSIELENGKKIPIELLSVGTIDQIYLSLRLNVMQDIIKESMPIILDESFSFYDDNRLENTLIYLDEEYVNRQKIIFSCSNREYDVLNGLGLKFNLIIL